MNNAINLLCSHSRRNNFMTFINGISSNLANFSDKFYFLRAMNWWNIVSQLLEVLIWLPCLSIIWFFYLLWNRSLTHKRVWVRSQWPSICISRFNFLISLLVGQLMHTPESFKAFLCAKIAWLKLQFYALGTLETRGFSTFWILTKMLILHFSAKYAIN